MFFLFLSLISLLRILYCHLFFSSLLTSQWFVSQMMNFLLDGEKQFRRLRKLCIARQQTANSSTSRHSRRAQNHVGKHPPGHGGSSLRDTLSSSSLSGFCCSFSPSPSFSLRRELPSSSSFSPSSSPVLLFFFFCVSPLRARRLLLVAGGVVLWESRLRASRLLAEGGDKEEGRKDIFSAFFFVSS